uniref:mRNA capping enzyme C-terminal domain-containing protein n=1 Tax=Lutzomyia longipalpis TaxID=7200 RepID=A0A1B0CAF0_LUTLO
MNRKASSNPGPVPERWIECPRKSDGFIANKFMAFKTPLDERFDAAIPVEATFTPELIHVRDLTHGSCSSVLHEIKSTQFRKQATPFGEIKFSKAFRDLDEKIIECRLKGSSWVFVRQRKDKSFPDSFTAAMDVYKSILYPVSEEMLLDSIT